MPSVVDGESAVLPAPAAFDLDDPAASLLDEPELDLAEPSISRPSRPFIDKDWVDEDHYFDGDLPTDQYGSGEWKETYKDIDEIQFNGSIRRHWKRGQNEVRQVIAQCRKVIGRDDVRREDLSRHFYGIQSPLFHLLRRRLGWEYDHFSRWASTGMRLSANQWTAAKLYDADHPQLDLDKFRAFTIEGRSGHQSYVIDDHKLHCELNPSKHRNLNVKFIKHVADNRVGTVIDTIVLTTTLLVANRITR